MTHRQHITGTIALAALVAVLILDSAGAADSIPKSDEILRRYIPASRLDAVTSKDAPGALLPISEFETLLQEAAAKTGDSGQRPAGAGLVRADYALRIHEERLLATCRATLRSFDADWQVVRLPIQGLSVLRARFDGDESAPRLSRDPKKPDELAVIVSEPGTKTLVLELSAPLSASGSDSGAAFHLVNAPLGEMTLTLPAGKRLRLDGLLLERPAADDKPADYKVAIGGRPEVRLVITDRKAIDRTDAMTFASTAFGVIASPGEATWTARTQLSVFGRPLDKLECEVPSSLEITDVESQGLEAWQLSDGATGRTRISLTWRQPFDGLRPITFRGVFAPDRDGRWRVPNLTLQNVSSHTGTLILERPTGVRLQVTNTAGIRPVAVEGKPAAAAGAPSAHYEIWRDDFSLEFIPAAKEREVQAAMSTLVALGAQGADLITTVDLETRFAPLFEADILLPAAWQVLEATHKGGPARWQLIPDEAGRNRIRISLEPPLNPGENRTLSITAHYEPQGWPVASAPIRFALPEVRLPQAGVVEALYGITADADLEVIPIDVVGLTPARQSDVDTLNRQLAAFNRTVRLGFTYQDTVFTGQLEVRRLPPRLTATCVTLTRIDAEEIASHVEAQLSIGGGGVRELTVRLPEFVGRELRFTLTHFQPRPLFGLPSSPASPIQQPVLFLPPLPVILEQKAGTAENGSVPWTIKLDRYASGTFVLQAELSQPRAIAAAGQVQQWTVPALTVVGADRESGAIGIEAADDQHLQAEARDATGQPMEGVDPIDFPPAHVQPRERLVAAFAYDRPGWAVTVTEQRLTRIPMPTAVIHKLSLASIVGVDGVKQVQADATLSAVGIQSLVVRLPQGQNLWGALVDGAPVQVHKSGEALSLPLSPVDPPSRSREIRLIYAPIAGGAGVTKELGGFAIEESPPRFLVVTGQGTEQPLTVLATQWTVHHPDDLDVVDSDGVFHPAEPLARDSLLHRLLSLFRVPRPDDAVWRIALLSAVAVLLWLFTAAQARLPKGLLGCLVLFVAVSLGGFALLWFVNRAQYAARSVGEAPPTAATPAPPSSTHDLYDVIDQKRESWSARPRAGTDVFFDSDMDPASRFNRESSLEGLKESNTPAKSQEKLDANMGERQQQRLEYEFRGATPNFEAESVGRILLPAQVAGEKSAAGARGLVRGEGLLSVSFGLQPPTGSEAAVLESTSDDVSESSGGLSIRFMDERSRNLWTSLAAVAVTLLGWWLRKSRLVVRLSYLLVMLLGPVSIRWLIPLSWLPMADGVWLGGLATALLWLLRGLILGICDCPCMAGWCKPRSTAVAPIVVAFLLGWTSLSSAQESAAAKVARPAAPAPETVFIPFDDVREPLSAKNVFVPRELFLKLWRAAHPEDAPPVNPPVHATVAAAAFVIDLTVEPEMGTASGRAVRSLAPVTGRLVLNNLTTAPTRIRLPIQGVAIRSAMLDGSPAILDSQEAGALVITLPKAGASVLDLQFEVPVDRTGPAGRFRWESSPVPAGLLSLKLPKVDPAPEVRVGGNKVSAKSPAEDAGLIYEIPIDRGGAQDIAWQPAAGRSGDDSPLQVQTTTSVIVDDAGITARGQYTAKVSQSGVTELTLAFPGAIRLKRVEGPDIGGWRIDGENAARKLVVFFSRKIDSETTFNVETFQPVAIDERQQTITVVPPQPESVSRETGKIGVHVAAHLTARPATVTGLTQEDLNQFDVTGAPAPHPLQFAYRYAARPVSLDLLIQRREAETRANVEHGVFVTQRKLRLSTRCMFHIAGAPRSTLTVLLPADYLLLDVTSPSLTDYSTSAGDAGRKVLTVELDHPRTGDVELLLNGTVPRRPDEPSTIVVTPRVLDVTKVDSQLGVWVEDLYLATADALGDWKNADPNSLDGALRGLRPAAMQFGFRSASLDPQPVTLGLRTQAAELSADALSLIAVSDASVDYGFTMQWRISRAATDTFSFTTPGWLRGRIDFAGVGVRQVTSSDLPGDRVKWTVSLTDPVRESYLLTGAASLPSPADGRVLAPEISFESSSAGGAASRLEAQRQFAVVVNLSRRPLALEDPAAVETVRRDALPLKVPDQLVRQAMNIVQIIPGRTASWLARRVEAAASLQATITGATLETVVEVDGSWRTQATYTLRNRGRQYLPLDLSAMGDVRLLSILVKGKPARALETTVGGKSLHLVPLPPSSASDLSYDVVVMLAGKLARSLPKENSVAATTLELPTPRITTPAESAPFRITVAQTAWIVRLPDGVEAEIDDAGNLTPHQAAEWELLASAQALSQLEADAEEMLRIVSDSNSSEQRRSQAWFNLDFLSSELDSNRRQIDEVSQRAKSGLDAKGMELWGSNVGRNELLKSKVELQLRAGEAAKAAEPQANTPAQSQPLPQLQGSLNLNFDAEASGVNTHGNVQGGPQAGQGRAYILDNSRSILNSNSATFNEMKDGLSVEFGFSKAQPQAQQSQPGDLDIGSQAPSRSGLKRKLAEQQQAAPNSDFSSKLGIQMRQQQSSPVGGIGGGAWRWDDGTNRFGFFAGGSAPAGLGGALGTSPAAVQPADAGDAPANWSSGAGLSLAMSLPAVGEDSLAFSKVGGDPKLILKVRSTEARRAAWGLAELAAAVLIGIWLLSAASASVGFARSVAVVIAVSGAAGFLFLPGAERWVALGLFVLAAGYVALAARRSRQACTVA